MKKDKKEKLDEEEREKIVKSQSIIESDLERENRIILDAISNEKRLSDEKNSLIEIEKKYYDLEKQSNLDFNSAREALRVEQEKLEKFYEKILSYNSANEYTSFLQNTKNQFLKIEEYLKLGKNEEAVSEVKNAIEKLNSELNKLKINGDKNFVEDINKLSGKIKISQETYASTLSKNQSIKTDTIKQAKARPPHTKLSYRLNPAS